MQEKVRINKYLAEKGITTRRGADALIESGKVFINDKKAVLGDKVNDSDKVEVKGAPEKQYRYFLYNKPVGLSTEEIITHLGNKAIGLFPVGRLDKASHGIILLTNDGRVTDRLLNPDSTHEKEYKVRVKGHLRSSFKAKMESGVQIEDYKTKPCKVEIAKIGGRASAACRKKRYKEEIELFDVCSLELKKDLSNCIIVDGWDADIVLLDHKIGIL